MVSEQPTLFNNYDLIHLSYKIRLHRAKFKILLQGKFRGIDLGYLWYDAREHYWDNIDNAESINQSTVMCPRLTVF